MIDIILVDDHDLFRMGTTMALGNAKGINVVAQAASGKEFFEALQSLPNEPTMALLDIILPDLSGVEIARRLRAEHPDMLILMLSAETAESVILELTEIGVDGFVSKNSPTEEIIEAINTIVEGGTYFAKDIARLIRDVCNASELRVELSEREQDIIRLCCDGMHARDIADKLCISIRTVDTHKTNIFRKLGIDSSMSLMRFALRRGIIHL
ncbi:MAG: response regulator transcription factor [Marinilabiliaceae bacterium]|nr:response regulator transcription factor [Marinilabiliaceae bacterium]